MCRKTVGWTKLLDVVRIVSERVNLVRLEIKPGAFRSFWFGVRFPRLLGSSGSTLGLHGLGRSSFREFLGLAAVSGGGFTWQ